jgi:aryl-alcohol dehydrogenase-like predicted oxidoreductase
VRSLCQDAEGWSPLALGCATFGYGIYAPPPTTPEQLALPIRTVRLALDYGITVFDTSPQYVHALVRVPVMSAYSRLLYRQLPPLRDRAR